MTLGYNPMELMICCAARLLEDGRTVAVGTGQRLFEDVDTSSLELTLADVRKLGNGSVILTYTPSYRD